MPRISVEVSSGTARFWVSVQAQSVERALEIAQKQNLRNGRQVSFPIDAEAQVVEERSVAGMWALGKVVA
jgi:hypothetical protein